MLIDYIAFGWRYASIFVVAYVYVDVFWLSACLWVTIGFNPSAPACSLPQGLCWGLRSSNYKWVYLAIVRKVLALVIHFVSKPSCTNYIIRWIPLYHPLSKTCQNRIFPLNDEIDWFFFSLQVAPSRYPTVSAQPHLGSWSSQYLEPSMLAFPHRHSNLLPHQTPAASWRKAMEMTSNGFTHKCWTTCTTVRMYACR